MVSSKFEPQAFFRNPDHVAIQIAASELFGILKRTFELPTKWAAMVLHRSGERQVFKGGLIEGGNVDEVFFARSGSFDLKWIENDLISEDGFHFRMSVTARLSLLPEQSDLVSFQKTLLGNRTVATQADLLRFLQPTVRQALDSLADTRPAAVLMDGSAQPEIDKLVYGEIEGACFAAGLTLEKSVNVELDSPAYRQVLRAQEVSATRTQEFEAAKPLREARAAAQRQHVDHLTGVLARLRELTASSPNASVPELIRTFSEKERAELYQSLFAQDVPATRTKWVVVAAGDQVLFFEGGQFSEPARRLKIAGAAGPVRSVQAATVNGNSILLLGAATGVYRLPIDRVEPDRVYLVPNAPNVRGGFNSVVMIGDRVIAAHSELGLWRWDANEAGSGLALFESMTRGAKAVRNLAMLEHVVYCAIDDRVMRWPVYGSDSESHQYESAGATVTSLCPTADGLFAGTSEGDIWRWDDANTLRPERVYRGAGRAVESIAVQSSLGIQRLFFADTSISAQAQVVGDSYTCRYEAGGQTIRRLDVADDLVVATNEPRDRLIIWSPGQPDRPSAVVPVGAMVQRSIQDVCLIAQANQISTAT